jgi:hypothetical protein
MLPDRPLGHARAQFRAAMRILSVPLTCAALFAGCTEGKDTAPPPAAEPAQLPPPSDYAVYSVVLREQFVHPAPDEHGDGPPQACEGPHIADSVRIVRKTRLRRAGGSQDSALIDAMSQGTAPLVPRLRSTESVAARTLEADSFSLDLPVVLLDRAEDAPGEWGGVTLSRVAYSEDGSQAVVLAVQPCLAPIPDDGEMDLDRGAHGKSILASLRRLGNGWSIVEVIPLYAE